MAPSIAYSYSTEGSLSQDKELQFLNRIISEDFLKCRPTIIDSFDPLHTKEDTSAFLHKKYWAEENFDALHKFITFTYKDRLLFMMFETEHGGYSHAEAFMEVSRGYREEIDLKDAGFVLVLRNSLMLKGSSDTLNCGDSKESLEVRQIISENLGLQMKA